MQGMSERQYAAHVGLSRGAIQKAKTAERLVLYPDGSINAAASDARRAETTDPSKTRKPPAPKLKPVPEAAVTASASRFSARRFQHLEADLCRVLVRGKPKTIKPTLANSCYEWGTRGWGSSSSSPIDNGEKTIDSRLSKTTNFATVV